MIDIEKIKLEIIECLKPLNPNKIILFGSYAYGTPHKDSDIDLFLLKDNLNLEDRQEYEINASIANIYHDLKSAQIFKISSTKLLFQYYFPHLNPWLIIGINLYKFSYNRCQNLIAKH